MIKPTLKGLSLEIALQGKECPRCDTPHGSYRVISGGEIETEDLTKTPPPKVEEAYVQCENGIATTLTAVLKHNNMDMGNIIAVPIEEVDGVIKGPHLWCPAHEKQHEGRYKIISGDTSAPDSVVQCPEGRLMPRDELFSYTHQRTLNGETETFEGRSSRHLLDLIHEELGMQELLDPSEFDQVSPSYRVR